MNISPPIQLVEAPTQALLTWAEAIATGTPDPFQRGQQLSQKLGATYGSDGLTQVGFWIPEVGDRPVYLEVFTPMEAIDFRLADQVISFRREVLELPRQGEFAWGVVAGLKAGTRTQAGSFYWLRSGEQIIRDVFAHSLPYGVFAPAELYDMAQLERERADRDYFHQETWVTPPRNILQIHVGTASPTGTLAGLTRIYSDLARKLANGHPLSAAEKNYVGFDAIELLPIEPTVEFRPADNETCHAFWQIRAIANQEVQVHLKKPDTQNWGYDDLILGAAATSPALLSTLRPAEVVEFVATLHTAFARPIQIIFDLVYGHIHHQALGLINGQFFRGANMYGHDTNQQNPMVRAVLLELQRRKINLGADGIRVDGGQDFQVSNAVSGKLEYDDDFLLKMAAVPQTVGTATRELYTIYEDGRPWPNVGWEDMATHLDLIYLKPDCFQWSPLIFEHNTPTLQGFWQREWRDVCKIMAHGDRWVTGCANHDTVRKGNHINTAAIRINEYLGNSLPEILQNAYDNPATQLWIHGFSPGIPMDFLNALMHTPWGFFRNTDDQYAVKIMAEEIGFLYWQITPEIYRQSWAFRRFKAMGFYDLLLTRRFFKAVEQAIEKIGYDLPRLTVVLQAELDGQFDFLRPITITNLKEIAIAFMEDGHEACRVSHYCGAVPDERASFNLRLRQYRQAQPWLRHHLDFSGGDRLHHWSDHQRTIFYGMRQNPDTQQRLVLVAHMAGAPKTVEIGKWLALDLNRWQVAIATPTLKINTIHDLAEIHLHNGEGFLLSEIPP
ncbi:alpha-amylase [Picosynechococcus sp. PCC 7003]|uniref:glucosylglycerol hydrolase n=1 Tax=Picosynechococcus sp. PCC 7003 TaxID=374981 RepID=UPI0008108EAE|nr:glucosylglycerol hydrolase [Picosynechococcus sp. PCC 7003]ANV85419.1 alpha-amylase [Picosynechococcus sp. PCC 7003]